MNEQKAVPNIRFNVFEDKWKKEKLDNMVGVIMGQSPSSSNYHNNQVNHSMILIQGNADLENNKIKPRLWTTQITKKTIPNDIILTVRAPVGEVAKNDFNAVLGRGVAALRGNKFLYYYLEKIKQIGYWNRISAGSTFMSISSDDIKEVEINLPTCTEQEYIYNLFTKLDKLLDLQQQKIDKLDLLKKALLQKLFPKHDAKIPELRFQGFEDDWNEKRLNSITKRLDSYRKPITANKRLSGQTPYYGANGIQDYVKGYTHEGEFVLIAEDGANDVKNYPVRFVKGYIWVNNHAHVLQAKASISNNLFLSYSLKNKNLLPYLVGSGRMKLNADVLMNLLLKIPSFKEQQKIGNLLSKVDQLIELENKKLHNLQQVKKCLLQNMFVE